MPQMDILPCLKRHIAFVKFIYMSCLLIGVFLL